MQQRCKQIVGILFIQHYLHKMEKKLYFTIDDGNSSVTMELSGCMAWIEGDGLTEETSEDYQYTLTPVWLTEEEFNNLPEAEV